jgi:hypothetical protein
MKIMYVVPCDSVLDLRMGIGTNGTEKLRIVLHGKMSSKYDVSRFKLQDNGRATYYNGHKCP